MARRSSLLLTLAVAAALVAAGLGLHRVLSPPGPPVPALAAPVSAASGTVSVFPAPGTPTASPATQLSFRGVDADGLGPVHVTGSRSGEHTGALLEHSDDEGVSFVPDEPFVEGEEVTVATQLAVRGSDQGRYRFTVAVLGDRPELKTPPVYEGEAAPTGDPQLALRHVREFASAPGLEPPQVEVTGPEAGTVGPDDQRTPGVTVLGVKNGYGQKGPMLVDDAGEPVWFQPLDGVDARDVKVQSYRGEPVLTWWEGLVGTGFGYGEAVIVDSRYQEVARVRMGNGYDADLHEVLLTDDGTMLLMAYEPVRMDLSQLGGPRDGQVLDNVVQEVDIATGAVLFEWHGLGQVDLAESYQTLEEAGDRYDYLHLNSIDVDDDGDLLVSARHTCAVYSIDTETGGVEWRLGGRRSDFATGDDARFLMQHDARRTDDGAITLFDNGGTCGETRREVSRGIALDVDEQEMTATLVREHGHPDGIFSESQASYQQLPGGDVLLGWGSVERWTLMDADGRVLLDAAVPEDLVVTSYRAYRADWKGEPTTPPSAVVDGDRVHVSWNGATEVARWRVSDASGSELAAADRAGFETVVRLPAGDRTGPLRVEALDVDGRTLGATTAEPVPGAGSPGAQDGD